MVTSRPLAREDRSVVIHYLRRYPPEISEMTFTNLFVWRKSRPIWLAEGEGTVFFLTEPHEENGTAKVVLGPPVGQTSAIALLDMVEEMSGFIRIPEGVATALKAEGLNVLPDRDNADYVYLVAELAKLEGRRFHKKRNLIAQCLKMYACQYEEITPQNLPECRAMQDRWCETRACGVNPGLCNEFEAIREVFDHYEEFSLLGGAVRVDGEIKAYTIGEELAPGTAVCHFEKAMPEIQGLGQLINQWFAQYSLTGFTYVNREQDLGVPGLRQAKESYFPHHMVNKFSAPTVSRDRKAAYRLNMHECFKHSTSPWEEA